MNWNVPLVEIAATDEDIAAVMECLESGWLTLGPRTQNFETALAEMVGTEHAVAVSSGSAALHLAMRSAGIGPGDQVIVPSMSFVACAHAVVHCGAEAVFCDSVGAGNPNLDPVSVEELIGPRTRAVLAVHMWGYPARVTELRELCDQHGIILIEDCADSIMAGTPEGFTTGTVGLASCFSFFSKTQLPVGEGGMILTDDPELAASARSLRSHAMSSVTWERHRGHGLGYDVTDIGFNYRIDEPRSALGLSRIKSLSADIGARRAAVTKYRAALTALEGLEIPYTDREVGLSSHFVFPVLVPDLIRREEVRAKLLAAGVQTTRYPAIHRLTRYADSATDQDLPRAADIADRHLGLPVHALLTDQQIDLVVGALGEALEETGPT